ncbi:MAG TPA: hypothetical protein VGA16_08780 [Candidatus Limnocylindria bacterium]
MGMLRALRPWAIVFVLGALLSFVVTAIGGGLLEEKAVFGVHESAASRRYMLGLLQNESDTLVSLSPKTDVVNRAMQYAQSQEATGQITPISLTYLGGRTAGSLAVHIYAIEIRAAGGQRQFFPLALTLASGKVVRRE